MVCRTISGFGVSWSVRPWPVLALPGRWGRHGGAVLSRALLLPQNGDKTVPPTSPWSWSMDCPDHPAVETG